MDREKRFNFKLLVPPRVSHGQVSAVRPQEIVDNADFLTPMQQGLTKCLDKAQQHISNKRTLAPTKPNRQDSVKMKVVSPMEKEVNNNNGELYSKLFDEIEKIKSWKVKVNSDIEQKERKLYENKRTIETQRKAIQELQFGNESLSIKLEEQISENDELRSRNNATRNLCNILKDTFERSVEKMNLFECEREETHHLLLENHDTLQKQIEAIEALNLKAETNQEELRKSKEELMQFEDLKKKLQQKYNMKEEEVEELQTKLRDSDNKLNNTWLDLQGTIAQCKMLQEEIDQKSDLLTNSNAENNSLCEKLQEAEQRCSETEDAIAALMKKSEETAEILQSKDLSLQELSKEKTKQTEKIEQLQQTVDELKKSLAAETQKIYELEDRVKTILAELDQTKNDLGEITQLTAKKEEQINSLMEQLNLKTESMESLKTRMIVISGRAEELTNELSNKTGEAQQLKEANENTVKDLEELNFKFNLAQVQVDDLQTHLTNEKKKNEEKTSEMFQQQREIAQLKCTNEKLFSNYNELLSVKSALEQKLESTCITAQTVEKSVKTSEEKALKLTEKIQKIENENLQLRCDLDSIKCTLSNKCQEMETLKKNLEENEENFQDENSKKERKIKVLETKVQNLTLAAEEAVRCQEDSELKCQNKIADMVTLMDKHKNQYDRMVQEKDAELEVNKEKEMKAVSHGKSLKQELTKQKKENDYLKKELKEHLKEKDNLQKELTDLKNKAKHAQMSIENKQLPISDDKKKEVLNTPVESLLKLYKFDFSKARRTPSSTKDEWAATVLNTCAQGSESTSIRTSVGTTPKSTGLHGVVKTPKSTASSSASKIKTYRIRTPPSTENKSTWEKGTIELDPKSDSSVQGDFLMFVSTSTPLVSASHSNDNFFRKKQSPLDIKSPKILKLAAMKRMRDAGWTAVSGNKRKKKTNEKIFS